MALAILFTLLLALCNTSQVQVSSRGKLHPVFIYLLFLGVNIGIIYPKYQTRQAYAQWAQAQKYYDMKIFATAAESYEALYPILKVYPDFLFEYGDALSKTGHLDKGNRILSEAARGMADPMIYNLIGKNYQAKKQFIGQEYYFLKAHYLVPNRLYPALSIGPFIPGNGVAGKSIPNSSASHQCGRKNKLHGNKGDKV